MVHTCSLYGDGKDNRLYREEGVSIMDLIKNLSISKYEQNCIIRHQIVTLFMTTYKRPGYIKLAIESVLKQTYSNFYLIILDNMSKDNTKEVVESFDDERVIYIEHDGSLTGSNFAYAFQLVKTKYIIVVHDDDILESTYLENMLSAMRDHKELTALSPTNSIIDSDGNLIKEGLSYDGIKLFVGEEYFYSYFVSKTQQQSMVFPAVIYNCELLGCINDYLDAKTGPAGDQFIWFEICRRGGKIGILGKPLIRYRIHNGQDSTINASTLLLDLLSFLLTIDYYKTILNRNTALLATNIRVALVNSLDNYKKGVYDRDKLKLVYARIPSVLSKNMKCRFYICCFKIAIAFPNLATHVLNNLRKLKNL